MQLGRFLNKASYQMPNGWYMIGPKYCQYNLWFKKHSIGSVSGGKINDTTQAMPGVKLPRNWSRININR